VNVVRKHYQSQYRFDSSPIAQVELNWESRDESVPVLAGLEHHYTDTLLRNKVVRLDVFWFSVKWSEG
jgi:hypothetical protein